MNSTGSGWPCGSRKASAIDFRGDDSPSFQALLRISSPRSAIDAACVSELKLRPVSVKLQLEEDSKMDDLKNKGAQDRARINVNEEHELRYWTDTLGISEQRLRELVKEVGPSADAVRAQLGNRQG